MGDWMDTLYTVMTTRAPTVLKRTQTNKDMRKKRAQMTKQIPGESKKENEWIWEWRGGGRVKSQ